MQAIRIIAFAVLAAPGLSAQAASDARVRTIAATCGNCHGTDGQSVGAVPSLAGLDKAYLLQAMMECKTGARETTVMRKYMLGYTDEEIAKLAEHFSKLQ